MPSDFAPISLQQLMQRLQRLTRHTCGSFKTSREITLLTFGDRHQETLLLAAKASPEEP